MPEATQIKEHPMLFSGEMVRAILDGRKTQTRRVVTFSNSTVLGYTGKTGKMLWDELVWGEEFVDGGCDVFGTGLDNYEYMHVPAVNSDGDDVCYRVRSRIETGDRLWVREAWAPKRDRYGEVLSGEAIYRSEGGDAGLYLKNLGLLVMGHRTGSLQSPWKPSIHMPRWACRLVLEVTAVRAQRVQDISKKDVMAEGCPNYPPISGGRYGWFSDCWDKLNAKRGYPWDANERVWVYDFRRVGE